MVGRHTALPLCSAATRLSRQVDRRHYTLHRDISSTVKAWLCFNWNPLELTLFHKQTGFLWFNAWLNYYQWLRGFSECYSVYYLKTEVVSFLRAVLFCTVFVAWLNRLFSLTMLWLCARSCSDSLLVADNKENTVQMLEWAVTAAISKLQRSYFCFVLRYCVIFLYHGNITWSCWFEALFTLLFLLSLL